MNVKKYVYNNIPMVEVTTVKGLKAIFSSLGASIYGIYLDDTLLSMTPKKFEDYLKDNIFYGKTIGPICSRIKEGKVLINGETYQMEVNDNGNTSHGGNYCLSSFIFDASIKASSDSCSITYTFKKPHMKDGLPGNVTYQITYNMDDNTNDITLLFNVTSDMTTPISLTNHTFFTLGDSNIDNLHLRIKSHRFVEVDKDSLLPLHYSSLISCMDFNNSKKLSRDIKDPYLLRGYDNYIEMDEAKLTLENDKYILDVITDFKGVLIYTDNFIDEVETINSKQSYQRGVAIEPQDSPLELNILNKDEIYKRKIIYHINKK